MTSQACGFIRRLLRDILEPDLSRLHRGTAHAQSGLLDSEVSGEVGRDREAALGLGLPAGRFPEVLPLRSSELSLPVLFDPVLSPPPQFSVKLCYYI